MSTSKENFIKQIYKLEQSSGRNSRPGTISKELEISNAATTDMARKLAKKGFVEYKKFQEIKLTDKGRQLALSVIRKHRLWESFLHKVFNMSLHEIHREAEVLEHSTSDYLSERISEYLGNPRFDPHGDPIPTKEGVVKESSKDLLLLDAEPGLCCKITRLYSSDREFFDFCKRNGIQLGSKIRVENQYPSNKMTEIETDGKRLLLNEEMARIIYVKQITDKKVITSIKK